MAVVAAGVHDAGVHAAVGAAGNLLQGERVGVGAEQQRPPGRGADDVGQDAGAGEAAGPEAEGAEVALHDLRGPVLRHGELRVAVEVAADGDEVEGASPAHHPFP